MDGLQETCTTYGGRVYDKDGVLYIDGDGHGQPPRRIPLGNVRIWVLDE